MPVLSETVVANFNLSHDQWELCIKVAALLKHFYDATVLLSGSDYCSVTMVYPILCGLKNALVTNDDTETRPIITMKSAILRKLNQMFFAAEWWSGLPVLASVLDPRYKRLIFVRDEHRQTVHTKVKKHMHTILTQKETNRDSNSTGIGSGRCSERTPSPSNQQTSNFFAQYAGENVTVTTHGSGEDDDLTTLNAANPQGGSAHEQESPLQEKLKRIDREFERYLSEPALSHKADPLKWWKNNSERFPMLIDGVKSLLAIPASNVPSESTFSTAGFIASKTRSALQPQNVNMLVFLRRNRHLFPSS